MHQTQTQAITPPSNALLGSSQTHRSRFPIPRLSRLLLIHSKSGPRIIESIQEFDFPAFHHEHRPSTSDSDHDLSASTISVESLNVEEPVRDWTGLVAKVDEFPAGCGHYGEVYEGCWINLPSRVPRPPPLAIKVFRNLPKNSHFDCEQQRVSGKS